MKFVDPKNDVAFKKIFGNEEKKEILISFLNAVLNLEGEKEIAEIDILNPYQTPSLQDFKGSILDIRAKDKRGVTFIVEMQVAQVTGDRKRFQYYAAKAYASQIERGEKYPVLNPVILIAILDYEMFEDEEDDDEYLSRHLTLNERTKKQELNALEYYFIELPKFTKSEAELTNVLDKWVYFIKHASNLDLVPESADTESLKAAYEVANQFGWNRDELQAYDYSGIKAQDERGKLELAEKKALQKGIEQGVKEGQKDLVREMLAKGSKPSMIAQFTSFSIEEIAAFAKAS
jgi:predicted transposase/invertase (TIGR01784 family)